MLPVSLFGMAVAAAELPELSSAGARDLAGVRRRVDTGLERAAFYVLPTMIGFVVLGDVLVAALFRSGAFGSAARFVASAVMGECAQIAAGYAEAAE